MIRRTVALVVWLVTASMNALVLWALADGFIATMLASLPAEEQVNPGGWVVVVYAAVAGLIAVTVAYATIGLLLAWRRGGGKVGAILLAGGAVLAAVPFGYAVGGSLALRAPNDPVAGLLLLIGPASSTLGYSLILPIVAVIFPDGRLPSRNWRLPVGLAVGALVAATTLVVLRPGQIENIPSSNPLRIDAIPAWIFSLAGPLAGVGVVGVSLLGVAAVLSRYRRGSVLERQQLRWFMAAVLLAAGPIAISPLGAGPEWFLVGLLGVLLVPVSVWIAVTRHRLYDIDRLISRGVAWAVLSGLLVAVYVGAVLVFQTVLGGVIQGETVAVAGSTLVAAALFQPLRKRVQTAMDRRFDRTRYDAQGTAAAFAGHLRDQIDLGALKGELRTVVGRTLAPKSVGIWLRPSEGTADR